MINLAGDGFFPAMVDGVEQIDAVQVRDCPQVVGDEAEQRVGQREVHQLRVPRQILVRQDAAQERPLLRAARSGGGLELPLLLLEQVQRQRDDLVGVGN